jgi:hypothetical protein
MIASAEFGHHAGPAVVTRNFQHNLSLGRIGRRLRFVVPRGLDDLHLLALQQPKRWVCDDLVGRRQPGEDLDVQPKIVADGDVLKVDDVSCSERCDLHSLGPEQQRLGRHDQEIRSTRRGEVDIDVRSRKKRSLTFVHDEFRDDGPGGRIDSPAIVRNWALIGCSGALGNVSVAVMLDDGTAPRYCGTATTLSMLQPIFASVR